jgi:hypothetical protein
MFESFQMELELKILSTQRPIYNHASLESKLLRVQRLKSKKRAAWVSPLTYRFAELKSRTENSGTPFASVVWANFTMGAKVLPLRVVSLRGLPAEQANDEHPLSDAIPLPIRLALRMSRASFASAAGAARVCSPRTAAKVACALNSASNAFALPAQDAHSFP